MNRKAKWTIWKHSLMAFFSLLLLPAVPPVRAEIAPPAPVQPADPGAEQSMGDLTDQTPFFGYGITAQLRGDYVEALLNGLTGMHFNWVRQPVLWKQVEAARGVYDWGWLDQIVGAVDIRGLNLLLVVSGTPDWARPAGANLAHDAPPADLSAWSQFMTLLAARYAGRVQAYQVWQSPNLLSHWATAAGPSAGSYVTYLQAAFQAVKTQDPGALLISAGLAPVEGADGIAAVDDLLYLEQAYQSGLSTWCDALGVTLDGGALAPQITVAGPRHFRHYEAVRRVMADYGDQDRPLWLTQVGWGVSPCDGSLTGVSELDQAEYLVQAFQMARALPYLQVMMVDNFNLSVTAPDSPAAPYSMIRSDWSARPAFLRLAQMRQEEIFFGAGQAQLLAQNRAPQSGVKPYLYQPTCAVAQGDF